MDDRFFQTPILNSPYGCPSRHWELDAHGQPTQQIIEKRRGAEFITPHTQAKRTASAAQASIVFDEGKGLFTAQQQYDHTAIMNSVRDHVDQWRRIPNRVLLSRVIDRVEAGRIRLAQAPRAGGRGMGGAR